MNIAQFRRQRGWTQQDLADRLGVNVKTVARWEAGETRPYPYHIERLRHLGWIDSPPGPLTTSLQGVAMKLSGEHPSTYFVENHASREELGRLATQDEMINTVLGILPEQTDPGQFRHVLDVGCGTGHWLLRLVRSYPHLIGEGIDVNSTMLDYAREQAGEMRNRLYFHQQDALRMLEFPAGSFDLVSIRFGVSYVRTWEWNKLISEMRRVCKPGGIVRICDTNSISATSSSATFMQLVEEINVPACMQSGHGFGAEPGAMLEALTRMMHNQRFQQIQHAIYPIECRAGTHEGDLYIEDMTRLFRLAPDWWRKWTTVPEDYPQRYEQMLAELRRPDLVANMPLFILWGTV